MRSKKKHEDVYEDSVAYLTENPDKIYDAYSFEEEFFGGALFRCLTPDGKPVFVEFDSEHHTWIGDIIGVHNNPRLVAHTIELTALLRADTRIPACAKDIRPEHLDMFAQYQRFFDIEIPRTREWEYKGSVPLSQILVPKHTK